tara:strand:- start:5478 stop:6044 length:567 start_codon:yes stop_codon:yes gene_type:complete
MCAKMTSFEEIKSQWNHQKTPETPDNGYKTIIQKVSLIREKQRLTNSILSITILILIAFFIYIAAYKYKLVAWALVVMIASLVIRIGLELHSIKKLNHLNVNTDANSFKQSMILYYKSRVRVHFVWTPILVTLYIIGFILLLPSFKENLSFGFYTYILISSIVSLIIIGVLIIKQIAKELTILKELKH